MGESTMDSAVLTATIKSMKLLSTMNTRQEKMASDISMIKNSQQVQVDELKKLNAKFNDDELQEITKQLNGIITKIEKMDLNSLSEHLDTHLDTIEHNITNVLSETNQDIKSDNDLNTTRIVEAISESDKSRNNGTLMKLIDGLKNMQRNVQQLATRVETLSTNVQNGRKDTKQLTETIQESNTRIMSMDIRMAALTSNEEDNLDDDMNSTIAFLEGFSSSEYDAEDE